MTVERAYEDTGLEDFDMADAVIPRLTIVHKEGEFKDGLNNEQFPRLRVVILGLVKQRVLWHPDLDDGDWPMCRSANFNMGMPNMSDDQPREKRFPWDKSGFATGDYPPAEDGRVRLPCSGCALKDWKSHPDGKKPYCTEQWTLPLLYDPREDENWVPAIITFQKTGLKPLKSYFTSFARNQTAPFTAITEIGLDLNKKGSTDYSVPNFKRVGDTDEANWRDYSVNFRTMRDFLQAEPGARDEDEDSTPAAPAAKEDPWATPSEPAAPAAKKPDVVEAEIVPEVAEKAPESQPAASSAPAPAVAEDDDLPF